MVREAKKIYMKKFLDPNLPPKQLWRNLDVVAAKVKTDDNTIFSPDQLNSYFTERQTITNISSSSGFVYNSNNFSNNNHDENSYSSNVRYEFSLTLKSSVLYAELNLITQVWMASRSSSLGSSFHKYCLTSLTFLTQF
jgi:hypothetical protein